MTTGFTGAGAAAGVGLSAGEPTASQLKAALLSQQDLGPSYTPVPSSPPSSGGGGGGSTVTGCPELSSLLNATTAGDRTVQSETYQVGQLGPFLSEALVTAPASTLHADYARDKAALTSCKSMTVNAGGAPLKLAMTPVNLGVAGSTAVRLSGDYNGVQINGDLAIDQAGQVELGYIFLQIEGSSQQQAIAVFKQADAKVQQAFGSAAGAGSSV
ncbi:hypothetical protein KDL01_12465 [Actinospica durhamensis]|uniref:Uncharacterized protein n=1 Tax=Actinospica durhamensis TaxID=1508375 RepID=A0A941ES35_9ACTN|nr:hypothetical protein [Actinospica durhamensis]MBR7834084.1 hypothetical protein [Actinospica durhamensis]